MKVMDFIRGQWQQRVVYFGPYQGDHELNRLMIEPIKTSNPEAYESNVTTSVMWEDKFGLRFRVDKPKEVPHRPVLDIDIPIAVVPSTTEGHYHLYIDKQMSWAEYERLLDVLVEVGIVEPGFAAASISRGYSAVRLPWVQKEDMVKTAEQLFDEDEARHQSFQV